VNVDSLSLYNFTSHTETRIKFPRTGIVLVTGENGAGKSSIIDGVSWAGWGKTIRGDVPWRGNGVPTCTATMRADDVAVSRSRAASKNEMEWSREGHADVEYENNTKAQEHLARIIGPWDLWRRSHVFSASDAMHFTLATDSERKKLIESFLGNDRFDPALKRCRADLKDAADQLQQLVRKRDVAVAALAEMEKALAQAAEAMAEIAPLGEAPKLSPGKSVATLSVSLNRAHEELNAANAKLRERDKLVTEWEGELRRARAHYDALIISTCPTCRQPVSDEVRDRAKADFYKVKALAEQHAAQVTAERAGTETLVSELAEEIVAMRAAKSKREREVQAHQHALENHRKAADTRVRLEAALTRSRTEISDMRKKLARIEDALDAVTAEVAELEQAEEVLGIKGVRAHILGRSLHGIEAVACAFLARLHRDLQLELKPYSEKGAHDSIGLTIKGRGRGTYKSNSAGERRRVDIALLLGLAAVSASAQGQSAGTLFFDEVFDCLDESGVDAVCTLLQELAQDRCVVVVTHSDDLIGRLSHVKRIHVSEGGKVLG